MATRSISPMEKKALRMELAASRPRVFPKNSIPVLLLPVGKRALVTNAFVHVMEQNKLN